MQTFSKRFLIPSLTICLGAGILLSDPSAVRAEPSEKEGGSEAKREALGTPAESAAKIDAILARAWEADKVTVAERSSDAEFLRRVSLDLSGSIPSEESARRFLSKGGGDREALIEELLASKAYARHMATRWANLLVGRDYLIKLRSYTRMMRARAVRDRIAERMAARKAEAEGGEGMAEGMAEGASGGLEGYGEKEEILTFTEWLERHFQNNTDLGQLTSELLTAEGTPLENPAVHYMLSFREGRAPETTGHVMRVFQGLQLQCAQCHDDKYEPAWTQRVFWGVTAFFARTKIRRLREGQDLLLLSVALEAPRRHDPRRGQEGRQAGPLPGLRDQDRPGADPRPSRRDRALGPARVRDGRGDLAGQGHKPPGRAGQDLDRAGQSLLRARHGQPGLVLLLRARDH